MNLQRITTEYIDTEDRIRLAGDTGQGQPVVIWLTQRLLQRLLPKLLQWLDTQTGITPMAEILKGFAQQAARAELIPQMPVQATSPPWLAQSVDVAQSNAGVGLNFRGPDQQVAAITLQAKPLRQWLAILHDAYTNAGWPQSVWPQWLQESAQPVRHEAMVLH